MGRRSAVIPASTCRPISSIVVRVAMSVRPDKLAVRERVNPHVQKGLPSVMKVALVLIQPSANAASAAKHARLANGVRAVAVFSIVKTVRSTAAATASILIPTLPIAVIAAHSALLAKIALWAFASKKE